jgi:hypothetical protein
MTMCAACGKPIGASDSTAKDKKGRLFHRVCAKRLMAEREARKTAAAEAEQPMAALLDDVIGDDAPAATRPCPNCGMPKPADNVACTACRYDEALGKVPKEAKAPKPKKQKAGASNGTLGVAMAAEEKEGLAVTAWVRAAVGAGIAGLVCAFIWGGFVYWTGWEIPIAALGVGFLVGCGAVIGVRSHAGFMSGLIAGVVTLASVFGGKFLAAAWYVGDYIDAMGPAITSVYSQPIDHMTGWMTDEQAVAWLVNHEVIRKEYMGQTLDWPDAVDEATATELDWYPPDIVERIRGDWAEKTEDERADAKLELVNELGMGMAADDAAPGFEARGVPLEYPRQHTYETAYFVKDYPMEVQSAAEMRWFNMSPDQQCEFVNSRIVAVGFDGADRTQIAWDMMVESERPENYDMVGNLTGSGGSAMRGMKGWVWSLIWLGASFFIAWGVGSGGKN